MSKIIAKLQNCSYVSKFVANFIPRASSEGTHTYGTQNRTGHPENPAVQLRLTCDQIRTGSESLHVKYGAKEKIRKGNSWEPCQHALVLASNQHWTFDTFYVL